MSAEIRMKPSLKLVLRVLLLVLPLLTIWNLAVAPNREIKIGPKLGGVTREMLESMTVPTLMSH